MEKTNGVVAEVTARIERRSETLRQEYLDRVQRSLDEPRPERGQLGCSNLAHGLAGCDVQAKQSLSGDEAANIAIVTAYNDMLSAHQPYGSYPDQVKAALAEVGAVGQVAGGVPAMCDGITQGRAGMELSLFSRDVIAMSTAVALSHEMFDGAVFFGICDKIIPGELIGALSFGHLPVIFVPAGPMPSGLSNSEKAQVRQRFALGEIGRDELLAAESAAYHAPGTCTFYGTANSNQMFMEVMGLQLPGSSFVNPGTPLRDALTREAAHRVASLAQMNGVSGSQSGGQSGNRTVLAHVVCARSIVNAVVGLLATGGSTNHTIHLVAIARAAGLLLDWDDFGDLSRVTPLVARVYPNGLADVNHFHRAGGMRYLIGELLDGGFLHEDVETVVGRGLSRYTEELQLAEDGATPQWSEVSREGDDAKSGDDMILRSWSEPFSSDGGLKTLQGNIGRAILKTSSMPADRRRIQAKALVFDDQAEVLAAFDEGKLERDFVAVVRFQGPRANGMPELHKLMPPLGVLQDRGFKVALVTDGRLSGASGKVPAALHVVPETVRGGLLARIEDGDEVLVDADAGVLQVLVSEEELARRTPAVSSSRPVFGTGRELFEGFRSLAGSAEEGASVFRA